MATIDKKLIHFNRKADFEARLAAGDIREYSIVCIKDAKLIWTHGQYYGDLSECLKVTEQTLTDAEKAQVMENLGIEIPTESTVSSWGFTKNTGTYSKPSGGIPKSDLASAVQTSLGKADTALQSYTEQYKGTITGVSANGTSVATSGVANIPAASTSAYGVTKLSSSTSSTSTSLAATASAVKAAYDLANSYKGTVTGVKINGTTKTPSSGTVDLGTVITSHQDISGKQDKLVSGTNIKTINGGSILGSGDINVQSDWNETDTASYAYIKNKPDINVFEVTLEIGKNGQSPLIYDPLIFSNLNADCYWQFDNKLIICDDYSSNPFVITARGDGTKFLANDGSYKTIGTSGGSGAYAEVNHGTGDTTFALTPNTFHVWDEVASLDLSFAEETAGVANEYLFQFTSGATATTLTLPDVKWANDNTPAILENMIYQVSVLRGMASVLEFSNVQLINFTFGGATFHAEKGMTWINFINSKYNTGGFLVNDPQVAVSGGFVHCNGSPVNVYDIIIENGSYYLFMSGGS